ncbi:MAG: insulinase family protein, partial [Longimicrobiales bacterium]
NEAMADVLVRPVTGEEVERAREALLASTERLFNDSRAIALSLSEWGAMGDWRLFFIHRDRLKSVTAGDVQRVALAYLKPSNRTVGVFIPDDNPDRAEIPAAPDVAELVDGYQGAEAVASGEAFDPSPENVERRTTFETLQNGMKVALLPKETRGETVTLSLILRLGSEEALTGRVRAGEQAAAMLMRGTETRTRQQIEDEMNRLQTQLRVGGGAVVVQASIEATKENFAGALALMGDVLLNPAFSPDEFQVLQEQQLAQWEMQRSEPQVQAMIAVQRHMNPQEPDHPEYIPTVDETIDGLESLTVEEVKSFHEDFYGAEAATLTVVGSFDSGEAMNIIQDTFGDWNASNGFQRIATVHESVAPGDIQIETPDKANAMFLAALDIPISDEHNDAAALTLANYIFGGGFLNSRLATRIRQEEGLSYGVGSQISLHPLDEQGQFFAFAIYAPENRDALEAAFKEEVQKLLDDGFSDEELQAGIKGYLEFADLQRAQDPVLAGTLNNNMYFGRSMEWHAEREAQIEALTIDQINAAVRRWIDPSKMTFVKAGDFEAAAKVIG